LKAKKNQVLIGLISYRKIWMGGVSIMSGSLSGAQGAFPARQIFTTSLYHIHYF